MALQARYAVPQPPAVALAPLPRIILPVPDAPGTTTASASAATVTDLGDGSGTWADTANAAGDPDGSVSTWAVP